MPTEFCFIPWSDACVHSQFEFLLVPLKILSLFHILPQALIRECRYLYLRTPLLHDADIYTSTLILYNSLNCNLIDTKLGTMVYLLLFCHSSELYGQKC